MNDFKKQFFNALLGYLAQRDLPVMELCKQAGINYNTFQKTAGYLPTENQVELFWQSAEQQAEDRLLGLHFGESMQLAALGLIGQIIYTSETVGEALSNAGGMIGYITDMFSIHIQHNAETFSIQLNCDSQMQQALPYTFKHMTDYLMVFALHELDGLVLERFKPTAVRFFHNVYNISEYERIFRCPVYQKTSTFALELPAKYWSLPIITANYELQSILLQNINSLPRIDSKTDTLQARVFNYLMTNAYLYNMSLEGVASNFNMSPRSLQRKLREEGITFLEIVEKVRKTLAFHYLKSGSYQIKDIAYTLGYNESSAFLRAFKRWTGTTPGDYRKKIEK